MDKQEKIIPQQQQKQQQQRERGAEFRAVPERAVDSALDAVSSQAKVDVALTAKHGVVLHTATHLSVPHRELLATVVYEQHISLQVKHQSSDRREEEEAPPTHTHTPTHTRLPTHYSSTL